MNRLILGMLLAASSVLAGKKLNGLTVGINSSSRQAWGVQGSARNSADNVQEIGCQVYAPATGTTSVVCWAVDASSNYVQCYSTNANILANARFIQQDTYLSFTWDTSGYCSVLTVASDSGYEPK